MNEATATERAESCGQHWPEPCPEFCACRGDRYSLRQLTAQTEGTRTSTYQYVLEADRLAGILPAKDSDRAKFYKARSPLGDAEFYLAVVDLSPAHRASLERLRDEMARAFAVKGKIPKQLAVEVAAIMRQDRALRPMKHGPHCNCPVCLPLPEVEPEIPDNDTVVDPRD